MYLCTLLFNPLAPPCYHVTFIQYQIMNRVPTMHMLAAGDLASCHVALAVHGQGRVEGQGVRDS